MSQEFSSRETTLFDELIELERRSVSQEQLHGVVNPQLIRSIDALTEQVNCSRYLEYCTLVAPDLLPMVEDEDEFSYEVEPAESLADYYHMGTPEGETLADYAKRIE